MLRLAMAMYDSDAVEQDAWALWRSEINDHEPGKGDVLVELNEYLNWMQTAEESEED
jgi:translation initiation factor 4G